MKRKLPTRHVSGVHLGTGRICVTGAQINKDLDRDFLSLYIYNKDITMTHITPKKKMVLTSVKVDEDRFSDFKVECIRDRFSLTNLVNRCMDLYLNDEDFKRAILNHKED